MTIDEAPSAESGTSPIVGKKKMKRAASQSAAAAEADSIPLMAVTIERQSHRVKLEERIDPLSFYACVARTVSHNEMIRTPAAMEAAEVEWGRLRNVGKHGCWDESKPRDKDELIAEARASDRKIHLGKLMELCVEKNHDIPSQAKFKVRVVYRGDCVKDEWGQAALFRDLTSCPATLEAAKVADLISKLDGCSGEQGDAMQAYPQAEFKGTETWIELPRNRWPNL